MFQKIEEEGIFHEASITLMSKPDKSIINKTKKLQTNIHYENQIQKSLTKYLAYQIQQYIFLKG